MKINWKLQKKLDQRIEKAALRRFNTQKAAIDFSSNDYLGFAENKTIFSESHQYLLDQNFQKNGSTGSRHITGNSILFEQLEKQIAQFHQVESCLLYNSGYSANLGFFSSIPQKGDIVLYDELIHASVRDGLQLSLAKSYKFKHNDPESLKQKLELLQCDTGAIYVVTESVFSMDGDMPKLKEFADICKANKAYFIVDEAHAIGVFGDSGRGLVYELQLTNDVFAQIVTFGKALGCHGAAVLCQQNLKDYLINFSRSLMYTTALPPHSLATIRQGYIYLEKGIKEQEKLKQNITFYNQQVEKCKKLSLFSQNQSPIQTVRFDNKLILQKLVKHLNQFDLNIKAILHPTVPKDEERLRICIHSFNTKAEISLLIQEIIKFAK